MTYFHIILPPFVCLWYFVNPPVQGGYSIWESLAVFFPALYDCRGSPKRGGGGADPRNPPGSAPTVWLNLNITCHFDGIGVEILTEIRNGHKLWSVGRGGGRYKTGGRFLVCSF